MRIVIDMQGAQSDGSRHRGIGRYTGTFAATLASLRKDHEIILAVNGAYKESALEVQTCFKPLLPPKSIRVWYPPNMLMDFDRVTHRKSAEAIYESFLCSLKPDVIIILSLFELEGRIATSVNTVGHSIPTVVMIYDLIPFIFSKTYLGDAYIGSLYLSKIEHLKRADLCFSISDSTKEDAVTYLSINKEKIVSVWCGIDAKFAPILLSDEQIRLLKNKYSIDREFVMYTGGTDWRKNIDGLIRGFARLEKALRDKHQLVVVCSIKDEEKEKFGQLVTSLGLNQADVIFTGYVSDDELIAFYNSCKLFVFPALYEGFPLPVLEAMACGAPTVVSEQASMFEEVGRKDMTFNPKSDESIAKKMEEMLTNDALRKDIKDYGLKRVKMFSWEKTADIVFDTLEGLVQNAKGMK